MEAPDDVIEKIQKLITRKSNYKLEAYSFVLAALHVTMTGLKPPRHISGQEFCEGIRLYAIDQFGPMAKTVFHYWGIHGTVDFGRIVFELIEIGLMRKTEEDTLHDFTDVYQFDEVFSTSFQFEEETSP